MHTKIKTSCLVGNPISGRIRRRPSYGPTAHASRARNCGTVVIRRSPIRMCSIYRPPTCQAGRRAHARRAAHPAHARGSDPRCSTSAWASIRTAHAALSRRRSWGLSQDPSVASPALGAHHRASCRDRSLGFPLPPECEGGRELAWLPKASRKPPESAGSSREAILKGKGKVEGAARP